MKKIGISFLVLVVLFVSLVLGLNYFFKNKIVYFLNNALADNISLEYEKVSVDSWEGTVTLKNGLLKIRKRGDTLVNTKITTSEIRFSRLSYWDYFVNHTVHMDEISVQGNSIWYLDDRGIKSENDQGPIRLGQDIRIGRLDIGETALKILKPEKDSLFMEVKRASFSLDDILINQKLITRKIPFEYNAMLLEATNIFLKIGPYENLNMDALHLEDKLVSIKNANVKTKYSKADLSSKIKIERDYIDLKIPELSISAINWGFDNQELYTLAGLMRFKDPSLEIYRDKLVADDEIAKPMYSAMLRSIPFDLMLDSLIIDNARITYNEKVKKDRPAGKIIFSQLNVQAEKLGNTYALGEDKTRLLIDGTFMETAPMKVDWSFDVQDPRDAFNLKGYLGKLPAERINRFTEPNLRALMTGQVERVYFNINGTDDKSQIDMRMAYDNFKVELLNKKSEKRKFLSAIANLFVSSNSKDADEDGYRSGRGTAERDKSKSFFNYLWLNLKDGLVKVLLGNGKID